MERILLTSCLLFLANVCLSCTVFEVQRVICRKSQTFLPHVYLTTLLGVTALEYRQDPWLQKTRALRYRAVLLLRYDIFSHFKQKTLAKSKKQMKNVESVLRLSGLDYAACR